MGESPEVDQAGVKPAGVDPAGVDPAGVDPAGVDPAGVGPAGADSAGGDSAGDGRRLRRDRNRTAVVDALLDLYGESNLRPSTAEIAKRAGLSHRSLFRYFDDFDDLCREAIVRAEQRAVPLIPIEVDPAAPLTDRIDALITQRLRLFEVLGPVALVSRLNAPFAEVLAAELTKNRAFLRAQLADLFAPELQIAPEASPAEEADATGSAALAAADVLCSFESFHLLTTDQHLTSPEIRTVLMTALAGLLNRPAS